MTPNLISGLPLPSQDQYTTYDYPLGEKRREAVAHGKIRFTPIDCLDCPGMPFIINFSEQLKYMQEHPTVLTRKLYIDGANQTEEVRWLSKEKTLAFALNSIKKYGTDQAEIILSAAEKGTLYWNIIYHYQGYRNLLKEHDSFLHKTLDTKSV